MEDRVTDIPADIAIAFLPTMDIEQGLPFS
jgi:hypothetical protein